MTTTDLVPVFTGTLAGQDTPLCNARDLHAFLVVGRDFATWIKERIAEYGFAEGEDFSPVLGKTSRRGGRPATDYHLTLDMAKELAMIENNAQGRQVRRYFIACEKRVARPAPVPALPAPVVPALDPDREARFDRRAMELAMRAYDSYRTEIRADHLIARGMRTIEEWLPPRLAENLHSDAVTLSKVCRIYADQMAKDAATIARRAGIKEEVAA